MNCHKFRCDVNAIEGCLDNKTYKDVQENASTYIVEHIEDISKIWMVSQPLDVGTHITMVFKADVDNPDDVYTFDYTHVNDDAPILRFIVKRCE